MRFLDVAYTDLDAFVDRHGLEKIKTSGDSYMVVRSPSASASPAAPSWPASSARKFFYDVWGDAVDVASRMESTDVEGRIQVPDDVYERLRSRFAFEERGEIEVKARA